MKIYLLSSKYHLIMLVVNVRTDKFLPRLRCGALTFTRPRAVTPSELSRSAIFLGVIMRTCMTIYDYITEVNCYSSAFVINFTLIFLRSKTIKSIFFKSQYPPLKSEPQSAGIHTFLTIASCPSLVPSAFSGGAITHE